MGISRIHESQLIPASPDEVWDFISSPANLRKITPAYMGFEITSPHLPGKMYPGMMISYKVRPLLGIGLTWVTEITHVKDNRYFVDEQRIGPFAIWHHEHFIEPVENGVKMTDIVTYRLPMGFLGNLAHRLFLKKKIEGIFNYRREALEEKFGKR
jgi:ligand-binding SRPBCC domain-containing protein